MMFGESMKGHESIHKGEAAKVASRQRMNLLLTLFLALVLSSSGS